MELPAGGTFHGQVACHKLWTDWGMDGARPVQMACNDAGGPGAGLVHAHDPNGTPPDQTNDVMGCGIGIVYESDVSKIKPEDFAMISINHKCPWYRDVDFQIPKRLPPCPPGGCHCMWGWIHNSGGGGQEMYMNGYRCNVTGETGTVPVPKPVVARKCPFDKNNCTMGAKQPHYWLMGERNNNHQHEYDPPYYNDEYGFENGAQNDLWDIDLGTTWNNNQSEWAPIPPFSGRNVGGEYIPRNKDAPVSKAGGVVQATPTPQAPDATSASAEASMPATPTPLPDTDQASNGTASVNPLGNGTADAPSPEAGGVNVAPQVDPIINSTSPDAGASNSTTPGASTASTTSPDTKPPADPVKPGTGSGKKCKRGQRKRTRLNRLLL